MKVKIGTKWFDGQEEPIVLLLTPEDRKNIEQMDPEATKYCVYPDGLSPEFVYGFMEIDTSLAQ